jgi:predicted nucleic acid-binding protein
MNTIWHKNILWDLVMYVSVPDSLSQEEPVNRQYGGSRNQLEKQGSVIGSDRMFIAFLALVWDALLITDHTREFSRVPGLE